MHIAAKNGHLSICKFLVEGIPKTMKADLLLKGLDGETAKDAALDMGKDEVGMYLQYHEKRS